MRNSAKEIHRKLDLVRLSEIEKDCRVNARMDPRDLSPRADKKFLIANSISQKKIR